MPVDNPAESGVVFGEHRHHLLGLGDFGEGGEAAQVAEHHRHLAAMARQRIPGRIRGNDQIGDLLGQEAAEPADPLDLGDLGGDLLLQRPVQGGEIVGERLNLVMQLFLPQHRAHPGEQSGMLEGLRQEVVAAGIEALDDIARIRLRRHEDDGDAAQDRIRLQIPHHADAVAPGHHDVEQDQVWAEPARRRQAFLAIGGGDDLITVGLETHPQDLEIFRHVVDGKDQGRFVQAARS